MADGGGGACPVAYCGGGERLRGGRLEAEIEPRAAIEAAGGDGPWPGGGGLRGQRRMPLLEFLCSCTSFTGTSVCVMRRPSERRCLEHTSLLPRQLQPPSRPPRSFLRIGSTSCRLEPTSPLPRRLQPPSHPPRAPAMSSPSHPPHAPAMSSPSRPSRELAMSSPSRPPRTPAMSITSPSSSTSPLSPIPSTSPPANSNSTAVVAMAAAAGGSERKGGDNLRRDAALPPRPPLPHPSPALRHPRRAPAARRAHRRPHSCLSQQHLIERD